MNSEEYDEEGDDVPEEMMQRARARTAQAIENAALREACDHEWEFKQDMIGDPEVVNGTMNLCWRECIHCGKQAEARPEDFDDGGDYE